MKVWTKIKYIAGFLAVISIPSALYQVDQTEQAVITRFGRPVRVITNPIKRDENLVGKLQEEYKGQKIRFSEGAGLRIKWPFIEAVNRYERRILTWDGSPEQIPTKDKKYIWVDATARWYIKDPLKFLQTVRTEESALARLDDIIDSVVREHITNNPLLESVRASNRTMTTAEEEELKIEIGEIEKGREQITREILAKTYEQCGEYGIGIQDIRIKRINYVESVKLKVEDRMIAERQRIAERYRSEGQGEAQKIRGKKELDLMTIMSEAYRQAEIIKGEGDAEAVKIYAQAYNRDPEFYQFLKTLEIYRTSLDSANIVLGTDNELFRFLKDYSPKRPQR